MGTPTFALILSLLSILSVTLSDSAHDPFLQCLLEYPSEPTHHPISAVIYTPNNSSYSSVLQSYIRNLRFNMSTSPKPQLILTATHESHIQAAIICSKKHNLQMKIRSGGHDYEGISYVSNVPFFILDMFNLRSITVDIEDESAWVEAGATIGEVYYRIAKKSNTHGFPAGICPTGGAGGHLSGGGYGNMMRKYGLSVDNIVDTKLIDVDGRVLNRESMGEDLFWAINGGGGASFGVILSYKIKLVRVPPTVTVFKVYRTLEQNATDLVFKWLQVANKLDEDIFIRLILKVVNGAKNGEKTIRAQFLSLFLGTTHTLLNLMNESLPELGLRQTDCKEMRWIDSVVYWAEFPKGTHVDALLNRTSKVKFLKRKSDYLKEPIPKDSLELIWKRMIELENVMLKFNPYGGRMSEISASATPFPHRAGYICKIQYVTDWEKDGMEAANHYINLTRMLYSYMTPFVSKDPRVAYLNYRDLDLGINHNNGKASYLEGSVYGIKYFMSNFKRLVQVKTKVDPGNFFRNEQSIPTLPY